MRVTLSFIGKRLTALEKRIDSLASQLPEPAKPSRFVDNGDGTVLDKETNLVWQKQDDGKRRTHAEAVSYCEDNEAKLPGKGWRLPTVKELFSLVDHERHSPAIDPLFLQTQSSCYWTSTPCASDSGGAWGVYFYDGCVGWSLRCYLYFVRAVRQNS